MEGKPSIGDRVWQVITIVIAVPALLFCIYALLMNLAEAPESIAKTFKKLTKESHEVSHTDESEKTEEKKSTLYEDLSVYEGKSEEINLATYITKNNFTINGNGVVTFRANTLGSNKGEITIRGGDADLLGRYVLSGSTLMISNLSAVNGYFDASNNNGASGLFQIESDGTIRGTLRAKSEQRSITFYPK